MAPSYDARLIESKWSQAWEADGCFKAPDLPVGSKFFNYDSGPFPNGPLHMGHVRTYLLGDVTARYQRTLGKSVLYCTEWDAFGLPNELNAIRQGQSPAAFTQRWIGTMSRQLRTLGISYDYSRIRATCDPAYYRWTQWLFLKLLDLGLISRRKANLPFCPHCETVLARMQVDRERCWRCEAKIEMRPLPQWFVSTSQYAQPLLAGLDLLKHWSPQVRNLVRGLVYARKGRTSADADWLISRQRSWGTPIPIIFCKGCGAVPVPEEELPVRLPDDLNWSLGPRALSSHSSFAESDCPRCRKPARRETDTLDCFFDDIWCFMACLVELDGPPSFLGQRIKTWLPIDCFHSGFDTVVYLQLHRFLAAALHENGELHTPEPIRGHMGNEMVLAGGRKMSKHLGNAVSPSSVIRRHGVDALRIAILWSAAPHKPMEWRPELIERATILLDIIHRLYTPAESKIGAASKGNPPRNGSSKAVLILQRKTKNSVAAIGGFVEDYRPNVAIEQLWSLFHQIEAFARGRLKSGRLSPVDGQILHEIREAASIALSLFAPHLAEEIWHKMGNRTYVVQQRWPWLSN